MKRRNPIQPPAYTETFKRQVIEEYLRGGVAKTDLLRKYGIRFRSAIQTWMKQLGYEDPYSGVRYVTAPHPLAPLLAPPSANQPAALTGSVDELRHRLEEERLRVEAYSLMLDWAEKEYAIDIKKKLGIP